MLFRPHKEIFAAYETLVRTQCLKGSHSERGVVIAVDRNNLLKAVAINPNVLAIIEHAQKNGPSSGLEGYVAAHFWTNGPKVIVINQRECEALESTDLNFTVDEYHQPFQTMAVQFPPDFMNLKITCEQAGQPVMGWADRLGLYPKEHEISYVLIHHEKSIGIVACTYFTSGQVVTKVLYDRPDRPDFTVEEMLVHIRHADRLEKSMAISDSEAEASEASVRAAINALFLLDSEGMRKLGPADPRLYQKQMERMLLSKRRNDRKYETNEREVRLTPIYYGFAHGVQVYATEGRNDSGSGGTKEPHWRRGHWRMQRHGPQLSLVKRIRIKPVFVNAALITA